MLSPDDPASPVVLAAVLVALIAMLIVRAVRKDRREYGRFKAMTSTRLRQWMFRKWLLGSFGYLGGSAVLSLLLAWQYVPLFLRSALETPGLTWLDDPSFWPGAIVGGMIGLTLATVILVFLARRSTDIPIIGDIGAILPRNRAELRFGAALSVNAGVVEELLFRLAVPALVFAVTGSALAAIILSILLFGSLHVYQGIPGVVGAAVLGAVLMFCYLGTGSILVPMVLHALIDLRSLVLIPVLVYGVHRASASAAAPLP